MLKKIRKNPLLVLIILFFALRIIAIFSIPIFNDEILYMDWIREIKMGYLMRPLDNGRQPLFLWFATIVDYFVNNGLLSLRFVALFFGFSNALALGYISKRLFGQIKYFYLSFFIYTIFPFALLHDSIGILDSAVTFFMLLSFILGLRLLKHLNFTNSLLLGTTMGLGLLTKSNALFGLFLLPTISLLEPKFRKNKVKKILSSRFLKWIGFLLLSVFLAKILQQIIVIQPNYFRILGANGIFIYPFKEWIEISFLDKAMVFIENFKILSGWFLVYSSTLTVLSISALLNWNKYKYEKIVLLIYCLFPFIAFCIFGRVKFPRYILPMMVFLIPIWSYEYFRFVYLLKTKYIKVLFTILVFAFPLATSVILLINYKQAFISETDKAQYFINSFLYVEKSK